MEEEGQEDKERKEGGEGGGKVSEGAGVREEIERREGGQFPAGR